MIDCEIYVKLLTRRMRIIILVLLLLILLFSISVLCLVILGLPALIQCTLMTLVDAQMMAKTNHDPTYNPQLVPTHPVLYPNDHCHHSFYYSSLHAKHQDVFYVILCVFCHQYFGRHRLTPYLTHCLHGHR